jgi:hypothetical protein
MRQPCCLCFLLFNKLLYKNTASIGEPDQVHARRQGADVDLEHTLAQVAPGSQSATVIKYLVAEAHIRFYG